MTKSLTPYILGDRGQAIDGSDNDVRRRQVKDKNGDAIGEVDDFLVDDQDDKDRFLLVEHGGFLGFGETRSLIPVDAVTKVTRDDVHVGRSRERDSAPRATPRISPMTGRIKRESAALAGLRRPGGRVTGVPTSLPCRLRGK